MDKTIKLVLWLVFTVLFGTGPLIVRFLNSRADQHPILLSDTLKSGDLFIVGAVIAADAIGKVLGTRHVPPNPPNRTYHFKRLARIVCACACVALLFTSSAEFAQVSGRIDAKVDYNSPNVVHDSIAVFLCIVAAGFGVMLLVED